VISSCWYCKSGQTPPLRLCLSATRIVAGHTRGSLGCVSTRPPSWHIRARLSGILCSQGLVVLEPSRSAVHSTGWPAGGSPYDFPYEGSVSESRGDSRRPTARQIRCAKPLKTSLCKHRAGGCEAAATVFGHEGRRPRQRGHPRLTGRPGAGARTLSPRARTTSSGRAPFMTRLSSFRGHLPARVRGLRASGP
jgi:hypothetical protein